MNDFDRNFDPESAKRIINNHNVNVSASNPIKDFFKITFSITLIITGIYLCIFIISGVILKNLSAEKQIALENFISRSIRIDAVKISEKERQRLDRIRNNILKVNSFPNTSNIKIDIIKENQLNALCCPNGNIYITSALYDKLKTDEELTFLIAHEIAHYRAKDHLLALRRNICSGIVMILLAFATPNNDNAGAFIRGVLNVTDLKFSRKAEKKADKYAIKILKTLYGTAQAGIDVMEKLKNKDEFIIEIFSSHPDLKKRIKYIEDSLY